MPCQHLTQIQQLNLPISDSDVLKIICPVCGNVEVCAYTPLETEDLETKDPANSAVEQGQGSVATQPELASKTDPAR
jgi:hypothetical protein